MQKQTAKFFKYAGNSVAGQDILIEDLHEFGLELVKFAAYHAENLHESIKVTCGNDMGYGWTVEVSGSSKGWEVAKLRHEKESPHLNLTIEDLR